MGMNLLKLNNDKAEFLMVGTQYQLSVAGDLGITTGQDLIKSCSVVWNLGVMFDCNLKSMTHVNKLVSTSYVTMRNITKIWHSLDQDTLKTLCHALVMSKIDYCNSTLLGMANYNLVKLQWVQNMLCRIVTATRKYDKISDQMIELHWLKVEYQIIFKIVTLMFRCVNNTAPSYLTDLFLQGVDTTWTSIHKLKDFFLLPGPEPPRSINNHLLLGDPRFGIASLIITGGQRQLTNLKLVLRHICSKNAMVYHNAKLILLFILGFYNISILFYLYLTTCTI